MKHKELMGKLLGEAGAKADAGVTTYKGWDVGEQVAVAGRSRKSIIAVGTIVRFQKEKDGTLSPVIRPHKETSMYSHQPELVVGIEDLLHSSVFR